MRTGYCIHARLADLPTICPSATGQLGGVDWSATGYGNCVDTLPICPHKRVIRIISIGPSQRRRAECWRIDHRLNTCITQLSSICSLATGQLCGVDWTTTGDWYRVDTLPIGPCKRVIRVPGVRSSQFCWTGGGWVGKRCNACVAGLPSIS